MQNEKSFNLTIQFACVLFIACLLSACQASQSENETVTTGESKPQLDIPKSEQGKRPTLVLSKTDEDAGGGWVAVSVDFFLPEDSTGPRVAEFLVKPSPNLPFVKSEAGDAVTKAQKQLDVQERPDGTVRCVVFSSGNLNTMETGRVVTFRFKRLDSKEAKVELLTGRPIFAPVAANDGLLVSDPLLL